MRITGCVVLFLSSVVFSKRVSFQLTKQVKALNHSSYTSSSPFTLSKLSLGQEKRITTDLTNVQNIQYYGLLKIGTSQVEMKFTFDTGSNQLWFPTVDCATCEAGTIRYDTSSSTKYVQTSSTPQTITYGRGQVKGYPSQDQVWFSDTDKVDQMPCLAVVEQEDLNGIRAEGILGLAPLNNSPYLLDVMKDAGLIDRRTISFAFHGTAEQTTLTFGEPDMSLAPKNTENGTFPLASSNLLYFVNMYSSKINDTSLGTSSSTLALIDTGTSLLAIPQNEYTTLLNYYADNGATYYSCGGLVCVPCDQLVKVNLTVQLGAHEFSVPHQSLWVTVLDTYCQLQAQEVSAGQWILGDVFIRNYFVVMDYDQGEITLYGQTVKNASIPGSSKSYIGWIIGGVIVGVILLGVIIYCIRQKCKKQKPVDTVYAGHGVQVGSGAEHTLLSQNQARSHQTNY